MRTMIAVSALFAIAGGPVDAGENLYEKHKNIFEYMKITYESNKQSMVFGSFKYDYICGEADDVSAGLAGQLNHAMTASGFYAFDGPNARREQLFDARDLSAAARDRGDGNVVTSILSCRSLTDGRTTLWNSLHADPGSNGVPRHAFQILPTADYFYQIFDFPIYLGNPKPEAFDLAYCIDHIASGDAEVTAFDPKARFQDRQVVHFTTRTKWGEGEQWIDLERGAIPLRIKSTTFKRGAVTMMINDDLRAIPGRGWLPFSWMMIVQDRIVRKIVIREADLDRPPSRATFALAFPKPVGMTDQSRSVTYPPRRIWSLLELPAPGSPGVRKYKLDDSPPPPAMPGARSRAWPVWPIAIIVIVLLILAGLAARGGIHARA